MNIRYKHY